MQSCISNGVRAPALATTLLRRPVRATQANAISPKNRPFDEGAAQVANLLKRDEKELMGKESIGSSAYSEFGAMAGKETDVDSFPEAFRPKAGASPFAAAKPASPFGDSMERFTDTSEPFDMSPTMDSDPVEKSAWWTKITLTQVVLALSFTTITLLMLATVAVVWSTGAISLNDN